ncbi:MAG: T9SS type A sorting domain-containing protein, partial [Bacteriovoracaceae bacterium]
NGNVLNNIGGAKMDFDVDYALAFNEGSASTNFYLDAARYGTDGHISSAFIGNTSDQSGTSTSQNLGTTFGGTGNIQFAYNSGFSGNSAKGVEMMIPFAAFSGVTNVQNVSVFAIIVSSTGFFSNECIPGDPGSTNPGNNWDATLVSGQDFFTVDTPMPIELTSFSALVKGNSIELAWQTATEVNNHGFEIERRQSGATDWNKIGFKQGQGTSNTKIDYLFVDNSAMAGKYSYRLKQIDRNGKFEYSKTVEATSALSPSSVELSSNFPNPFNPSTSISFTLGATGKASLKVYDVLGKEVAIVTEGIYNAGELNTFNFNADGLTSGVYYYRLMSDAKVETRKMILMK